MPMSFMSPVEEMHHDLLPRVFHRLYMGLLALPRAARSLEEARVKKLLQAWRDAEFYPTIYLDGLEAAAFAGALGTDLAMEPQSKELRMKLEAYAALDPLALERRCRNRGLWTHSGSDQLPPSKSTLLQRLQCFEVYWSGRASDPSKARTTDVSEREPTKEVMDDIDGTPVMDDIDGTPIQTPLFAELQQQRVLRNHPASAGGAISAAMTGWSWAEGVLPETAPISESPAPFQGCVDDDLDGEPIGALPDRTGCAEFSDHVAQEFLYFSVGFGIPPCLGAVS
ncbi:U2surp [Symbiodinium microadriaticum]|nr:U2surp [Symbiodinium microadriaticum]